MSENRKNIPLGGDDRTAPRPPSDTGKPVSLRLGQSIMLEEQAPAPLLRAAVVACFAIVVLFLIWAQFAEFDEVAVASGEVIPSGTVQTLQHIDGGTISDISIKEGDIVSAGQVLLRLDPTDLETELNKLLTERAILTLKTQRLNAFVEGGDILPVAETDPFPHLREEQKNLLKIQRLDLDNQRNVLQSQLDQRLAELDRIQDQTAILERQIVPLREQLEIRGGLLKNKTLSRYEYLDAERQYLKELGDLEGLTLSRKSVQQAIAEAQSRLLELDGRTRREALSEMADAHAELVRVEEEIAKHRSKITRRDIASPVKGIIQGLDVHSIGTVIKPGNPILSVVPIDQSLVLEVRIRPKDIGFVRAGQDATVKFTTYNFSRYGSVKGQLTHVSATTFQDAEGETFYKGKVALSQAHVGTVPEENMILPGMTATADINSGKKTLLEYLLKPIHTTLAQSFRER
ncbi:HlyD family type I secretion membrane fusion protein [Sneathiella chinensis]|uniref:Membrane fusion protein (MFP) family protein n=2 Tax=Sneathiella chinensis TaxID=349750 RepID=A0ABQ5U6E6_9PROT|nr:HlyD family type I secretion membrane fusion protein [Sneathiella chinensis]